MSKNKLNKVNGYSSDSDEMTRMLKVLGSVVLVLLAFYFIFAIVNGEISFGKKKKETKIQNVEILAGNIYLKSESSYYVMMYDFSTSDSSVYSDIYSIYINSGNTTRLYVVDLSKKFNSDYVTTDRSSVNVDSVESLKVMNGTLIKVEEGKGSLVAIGSDEIKKNLFTVN